mmetsp:Transcript_3711/g.4955  ORF Transcript_3711/g.4955 Transcript_3711/m.4955 type:complete len:104 (+) Transcript_3711:65-376(+)
MRVYNQTRQLEEGSSAKQKITSIQIFRRYIVKKIENGIETFDASEVFSKECFLEWLRTRNQVPKQPEESFRRALTAHIRASDRRSPFSQEEEAAILCILRKKV